MKMKYVWAAALMAPLVVNSQCRVTELGAAVEQQYPPASIALDNNGNAMTVSPEGVATIWGSDGMVKAVAPVGRSSTRPFSYSMNDKGEALIGSDSCAGVRPSYSTNLAIWNWRNGSVNCLKNLPFEMDEDFRNTGYQATVLDNNGWVYTTVENKTLKSTAVAWPPNRSAVLLPFSGENTQSVFGGSVTGWVVGSKGNNAGASGPQPTAWKDQTVVDSISWPTEWGRLYAVATNGDMLGYASYSPSGYDEALILVTDGGKSFQYFQYSATHLNSKSQMLGLDAYSEPFIVSNGKAIPLNKRMPADWSQSDRRIIYFGGLNDKSQILAKYYIPYSGLGGAILLSGCFGKKP